MNDSKCNLILTGSRFQFVDIESKSFEIFMSYSFDFPEVLEISFIFCSNRFQHKTGKAHKKMKVNQSFLFWIGKKYIAILYYQRNIIPHIKSIFSIRFYEYFLQVLPKLNDLIKKYRKL